jgi:hypothetical protein
MKHKWFATLVTIMCVMLGNVNSVCASGFDVITDGTEYSQIVYGNQEFGYSNGGALEAREQDIIASLFQESKKPLFEMTPISPTRDGWYQIPNLSNFVYYGQLQYYTCGPACVKMGIKYLSGNAIAESVVASGCNTTTNGTYLYDMKNYINSMQSSNIYTAQYGATKSTMKTCLYNGIVFYVAPPVVGLHESTLTGWPYDLNAHFVVVYSIKDDQSSVKIADPWGGYVSSSSSGKLYTVSTDMMYTAYSTVNLGLMY